MGIIIPKESKEVSDHVDNCLEETVIFGLNYISQHGGYYNVQEPNIIFFTEKIPYYFKDNKVNIPEINIFEKELSNYVKSNLELYLDFEEFREKGFIIETGDYFVDSEIKDKLI